MQEKKKPLSWFSNSSRRQSPRVPSSVHAKLKNRSVFLQSCEKELKPERDSGVCGDYPAFSIYAVNCKKATHTYNPLEVHPLKEVALFPPTPQSLTSHFNALLQQVSWNGVLSARQCLYKKPVFLSIKKCFYNSAQLHKRHFCSDAEKGRSCWMAWQIQ